MFIWVVTKKQLITIFFNQRYICFSNKLRPIFLKLNPLEISNKCKDEINSIKTCMVPKDIKI